MITKGIFWLGVFASCGLASAGTVFVLNADSGANGASDDGAPFFTGIQEQYLLSGSQFSAVPVGSQITSIGLRLASGQSTIATEIDASMTLELSTSQVAIGSMSNTFANNEGADLTTVLSGSVTIPGGSFVGGAGPNPFYFLNFSTPYTYQGGDLLVTFLMGTVTGSADLDANLVGTLLDSADAGGSTEYFNVPVMAFTFNSSSPAPEPATLSIMAGGLALLILRRPRAKK